VSYFTIGIDSGFANDVLPLALSGVARTIDSIRVTEMFNYTTYPDATAVYDILGFGKPPEEVPFAATPGVFTFGWGPVLHQLADGLGVRVDDSKEPSSAHPPTTRSTPRPGTSPPEQSRYEVYADRVGRGQSDLCHRPHPSAACTTTSRPTGRSHTFRSSRVISATAGPPARRLPRRDRGLAQHAVRICALEMAEAIITSWARGWPERPGWSTRFPAVCAAKPDFLSALDLPLITGKGLVRPVAGLSPDSRLVGISG
jgi:4-hydroxy-tetrahydrodipicolinate reductase